MPCHKCPPTNETPNPNPNPNPDKRSFSRLLHWTTAILPEGSALLSSSCCWFPTILDMTTSTSLTAATTIHELRPIFLGISIITLMWSIRRDGLNGRNIARAIICVGLLAWAYSSQVVRGIGGGHSCH